ncbi:MAG: DNA internalization-related competence protein ComEC/Rec2 [Ideonella sp.]|nr:DNA internalization-related competence protein ComEC/Rec2 [Ideonella sp.]
MVRSGLDVGWRLALTGLAWLAGIGWQLQQAQVWPVRLDGGLLAAALALVAVACGLAGWRRARESALAGGAIWIAVVAAAGLLGAATTDLRAHGRLADALDPALEGQDLLLTGVVASLPHAGPSGTRFNFEVESARRLGRASTEATSIEAAPKLPATVSLGWYLNDHDEALLANPRTELRAGERWRLPVRLKRPHGSMNPEGFDVELWWWEQGVRANGYVRVVQGWSAAERLDTQVGHPVERLRQALRDAILRHLSDPRLAGIIAALVVGDQAAIEREDWELFRNTGIAHLMSISGLHITMFAWVAGAGVGWAWRRSARLMLHLPAPQAARWGGLAVATGYALLAGWGVPAERTLLMLACTVLLRSLGARWPFALVLLAAAVVVTLFDPWALLQAGFWLSFAAVGLLLASEGAGSRAVDGGSVSGWRDRIRAQWQGHLRSQTVATLGLAPLSLVFFQQLSIVGFLANLVAIPLVTLLITPLALLGVLFAPLWTGAAWVVQWLVTGLGWLAAWPMAVWAVPAAPLWAQCSGLAGALLGVMPWPWRLRAAAVPLMLPLLWPAAPRPAEGQFDAVVADIGQGTAVLIRTREHLLVYDAGPQYSRESDAGQRVLLPLLRARGEHQVDLLMLSHRDIDHVGGAASLYKALPVLDTSSSLADDHPLLQGRPHRRCEDGQSWLWAGVRFDVLHPTPAEHAAAQKPNAVSCVLKVTDAQGRSLLLTGDIEAAQETALLQRHAAELSSHWLLVPHHGSRTSSSVAFLDAVRPQRALVQAGYRSRFGHPAPDVVARYDARQIEVVRTDRCGAWMWHDGATSCTREVRRRYWHWNSAPEGANAGANVAKNPVRGEDQR